MSDLNSPLPPPLPGGNGPVGWVIFLWLLILGCLAYVAAENYLTPPSVAAAAAEENDPGKNLSPELAVSSRYAIGAWTLNRANPASLLPIIAGLDRMADSPVEKFRLAIIVGEIQGGAAATQRIDRIKPLFAGDVKFLQDADDVLDIYQRGLGSLSAAQQDRLVSRHGWFGRVALAYGAAKGSPAEQAMIGPAMRTLAVVGGFVGGIFLLCLPGLALFVTAVVFLALRKVQLAYRPPIGNVVPLLEAFALYLVLLSGVGAVFRHVSVPDGALGFSIRVMVTVGCAAIPIIWPMFRGMPATQWRERVGWHTGSGALREIGIGLLAYIGGIPIIAVGFCLTLIFSTLTHAHPSHPITRMIGQSPALTAELLFLASVFAPITEETLFRGCLFGYLRGRHGWLVSAVVVSTIFAGLHPQGWIALPALFSIAFVFSAMREWRGSLLPSMAAHCLNNTLLLVFLTVSLS